MAMVAGGANLDVDRGPNWLFVKLQPGSLPGTDMPDMADALYSISAKHFIYRLVLEMNEFENLPSDVMGQLVMLQERLHQRGGALRLCGMSSECEESIHARQLDEAFPNHATRVDAVKGQSVCPK